mmetsp:Transcript_13567/g.42213  ORF Transcript_13567/g.42213 Transcript_13567/m.42213 type:complete len:757 (-) Transcript_13567:176-2446(-)
MCQRHLPPSLGLLRAGKALFSQSHATAAGLGPSDATHGPSRGRRRRGRTGHWRAPCGSVEVVVVTPAVAAGRRGLRRGGIRMQRLGGACRSGRGGLVIAVRRGVLCGLRQGRCGGWRRRCIVGAAALRATPAKPSARRRCRRGAAGARGGRRVAGGRGRGRRLRRRRRRTRRRASGGGEAGRGRRAGQRRRRRGRRARRGGGQRRGVRLHLLQNLRGALERLLADVRLGVDHERRDAGEDLFCHHVLREEAEVRSEALDRRLPRRRERVPEHAAEAVQEHLRPLRFGHEGGDHPEADSAVRADRAFSVLLQRRQVLDHLARDGCFAQVLREVDQGAHREFADLGRLVRKAARVVVPNLLTDQRRRQQRRVLARRRQQLVAHELLRAREEGHDGGRHVLREVVAVEAGSNLEQRLEHGGAARAVLHRVVKLRQDEQLARLDRVVSDVLAQRAEVRIALARVAQRELAERVEVGDVRAVLQQRALRKELGHRPPHLRLGRQEPRQRRVELPRNLRRRLQVLVRERRRLLPRVATRRKDLVQEAAEAPRVDARHGVEAAAGGEAVIEQSRFVPSEQPVLFVERAAKLKAEQAPLAAGEHDGGVDRDVVVRDAVLVQALERGRDGVQPEGDALKQLVVVRLVVLGAPGGRERLGQRAARVGGDVHGVAVLGAVDAAEDAGDAQGLCALERVASDSLQHGDRHAVGAFHRQAEDGGRLARLLVRGAAHCPLDAGHATVRADLLAQRERKVGDPAAEGRQPA